MARCGRETWIAFRNGLALFLAVILGGCASMLTQSMVEPLSAALNRQTDLDLVCEGTPSLLLLLDGFIAADPRNPRLLQAGTQAYAAYVGALEECGDGKRARALSAKAHRYGLALLGLNRCFRGKIESPLDEFTKALAGFDREDVGVLFWGGYGWAVWINQQEGGAAALADLPRVEQIMLRVVALDESFYQGAAHLVLGAYYGARPRMYGGRPGASRRHFERALVLSGRQFLPVQVAYAQVYARQTLNRKLFVSLLREVVDFPVESRPDLSLSNVVAQKRARRLLARVDEFF